MSEISVDILALCELHCKIFIDQSSYSFMRRSKLTLSSLIRMLNTPENYKIKDVGNNLRFLESIITNNFTCGNINVALVVSRNFFSDSIRFWSHNQ